MKGFVLGFITAVLILIGGMVLISRAEELHVDEVIEESEEVEYFDEFVEASYDFFEDIVEEN